LFGGKVYAHSYFGIIFLKQKTNCRKGTKGEGNRLENRANHRIVLKLKVSRVSAAREAKNQLTVSKKRKRRPSRLKNLKLINRSLCLSSSPVFTSIKLLSYISVHFLFSNCRNIKPVFEYCFVTQKSVYKKVVNI
jgi:hypothetical protein